MQRVNITIPAEEIEEAKKKMPEIGIQTFSALVRYALKQLPPRKTSRK